MNDMNPRAEPTADDHRCQEASVHATEFYIPCNKPARKVVLADGKETRMCDACAWHSEKNRNMQVVRDYGTKDGEKLLADLGANGPPDPIDTISAAYEADREEAANWTDGTPVENEAQMKEVDARRAAMRQLRLALEKGQKEATAPLRAVYQAELDRWKPTIEDAKRIEGCLVATVDAFKRKLAAEKKAAERAAWEETNRLRREAEEKARAADASNLEAQREAEAAKQAALDAEKAALDAEKAARAAGKDQVKGMRNVTRWTIESHKAALTDINTNDKEELVAFIEDYVRRKHKARAIDGVRVWTEQEAY